ncbi:c-type cytochrome [Ideonella sp.]|uniref:c-type cytochrome n=1 Tax=Ideonella sp. TaxID=1929293 RepID=UPI002B45B9FE|nr:c-type cytochrome [Ideonella sp.]HJV70141.1 c-type cytochrome [Ideonella sp.]
MRANWTSMAIAAALALCVAPSVLAQSKPASDFGKREFEGNCASCHGMNAKGNGPLVEMLRKSPPDLTLLAKANGGVFPMARLYDVIDGQNVPSHGSRDMPIWGRDYKIQAAEHYMDMPYDPEAYTRARILALLEYLNRLQVK